MMWIVGLIAFAVTAAGLTFTWRLIGTTGQHAEPWDWRERTLPFRRIPDKVDELTARYDLPAAARAEILRTQARIEHADLILRSVSL